MNREEPNREQRDEIVSRVVRLGFALKPGSLRRDLHVRSRDDKARFIGNGTRKAPCRLPESQRTQQHEKNTTIPDEERLVARHSFCPFSAAPERENRTSPPRILGGCASDRRLGL